MTESPTGRARAGVLVVIDGRLALIDRVRPGSPPYSAVPGGGVEPGESFEAAAVREAKEELGLDVELRSSSPTFVLRSDGAEHRYFLADAVGGTFGTGTGPEMVAPRPEKGTYSPVQVRADEAVHRNVAPLPLAEALLQAFASDTWPTTTVELTDPRDVPPVRVRAGAICIDEDDRILVNRAPDREPFYELPGGGVEDGETVEEAVVRELEEEAGLHVRIERTLANVWKDGREEHYFLVRPDGPSPRVQLDLEPGFTQEWVPISSLGDLPLWPKRLVWRVAAWHAQGSWPDFPVELTDTILDLTPHCSW